MPRLHEHALARLVILAKGALQGFQVIRQRYVISSASLTDDPLDKALPGNPSADRRDFERWVSEAPLSDFVRDRIERELSGRPEAEGFTIAPLSSVEGYGDLEQVATRYLEEFQSLPWTYAVDVPVPNAVAEALRRIAVTPYEITPTLQVIEGRIVQERADDNGVVTALEEKFGVEPLGIGQADRLYFRLAVEGYFGTSLPTATQRRVESDLRTLLGLMLSLNLVAPPWLQGSFGDVSMTVRRLVEGAWTYEQNVELGPAAGATFQGLAAFPPASGEKALVQAIIEKQGLRHLRAAMQAAGPDGERVRLASQWLFDSYSGRHSLLAFVQAVVSLEILLGDKPTSDQIGLGKLLENRCAYLIGQSTQERDAIMKDFARIYKTRSNIVHTGKSTLSRQDERDLDTLRRLCARVIAKEAQLLDGNGERR